MAITIEHFFIRKIFGEEKAFEMIKQAGFSGVDYSFNALGNGSAIELDNCVEKAQQVKNLLDKHKLTCDSAHAPFVFKYGDSMCLENKNFLDMVRSIEFSSIIGAKTIVIHSIPVPEDVDFFEYNKNYYKAYEPYAEKFGIQVAVENLVNSKFSSPQVLSEFVKSLGKNFCACIDVGHAEIIGVPADEFISGMEKGLIKCVHLHDNDKTTDGHLVPYQGLINWDNVIKALADYGFTGNVNLEIIHCFDKLPLDLYQSLLNYSALVGKHLEKNINEYK